jgi:Family of unknown function (DUF6186)
MRTLTIAGFAATALAAAVLYAAGRARRLRLAPLAELLEVLRARRVNRIVLTVVWVWVGWHLLAR